MKELLVLPVLFTVFFGFASELTDLAQESSNKALALSYDMSNAIDCAAEARPLEECSPGIYSHDLSDEFERAADLNEEIAKSAKSLSGYEESYEMAKDGRVQSVSNPKMQMKTDIESISEILGPGYMIYEDSGRIIIKKAAQRS